MGSYKADTETLARLSKILKRRYFVFKTNTDLT